MVKVSKSLTILDRERPERWLPVVGYEGLYEVSNDGHVRSLQRSCLSKSGKTRTVPGKILKGSAWGPYLCVTLFRESVRLRRNIQWLVAAAFIGPKPSPKLEVCHNDGEHHNNRDWNLRYDTRAGNFADKKRHGTSNAGAANLNAKLTEAQAREILVGGGDPSTVAAEYGISPVTVYAIRRGQNWRHLSGG